MPPRMRQGFLLPPQAPCWASTAVTPRSPRGARTLARELNRQIPRPDLNLLPPRHGALPARMGTWLKHEWPQVQVVAIAAAGAPAMEISWREGRAVSTERVSTIADGIAVRVPVPYALEAMRGTVDAVRLVDDDKILQAMRLLHETLG